MTSLPPHGSLRRRSVLRALGVAASRAWCSGPLARRRATGQPARAAEGELTGFEVDPRRGRRLPQLRRQFRARQGPRGRAGQVGAALLRRRGRDLPRPLVLARPPGRARDPGLEDRLPAADVDLPRDHRRRPEPELPDPRGGDRGDQSQRRAGRSPRRPSSTTAATTSSSTTGSTSTCCRGRCRSASAASPTGSCRSSAPSASTDERLALRGGQPRASAESAAQPLGLDRLDPGRPRRRPRARLPARHRDQQPGPLRAPLRLAVLGQRRAGEHARRGHRRRRRAHALARLARPLRQPPAAQAGGDLRPRRHPARRPDLRGELPVRLALDRDLVRRQGRRRARRRPQPRPRHDRRDRQRPRDQDAPGGRAPRRERVVGRAALARAPARAALGARDRGRRQLRPDAARDRQHDLGADARARRAADAAPGAHPARRQPGRGARRGGLGGGGDLRRVGTRARRRRHPEQQLRARRAGALPRRHPVDRARPRRQRARRHQRLPRVPAARARPLGPAQDVHRHADARARPRRLRRAAAGDRAQQPARAAAAAARRGRRARSRAATSARRRCSSRATSSAG